MGLMVLLHNCWSAPPMHVLMQYFSYAGVQLHLHDLKFSCIYTSMAIDSYLFNVIVMQWNPYVQCMNYHNGIHNNLTLLSILFLPFRGFGLRKDGNTSVSESSHAVSELRPYCSTIALCTAIWSYWGNSSIKDWYFCGLLFTSISF